jgi:hypothetical protein
MVELLRCEDNKSSRRMQGKRVLAVNETCKVELKNEIQLLYKAYEEALTKSSKVLSICEIDKEYFDKQNQRYADFISQQRLF